MTNYDFYSTSEYKGYTKEDGYREILHRYVASHKGVTYKELLVKCKDKKTNPFSASMARWFISEYSDIAEQCDHARDVIREIVEKDSLVL